MKTPVVLQAESAECGLACLCMIMQHHGFDYSIQQLREIFGTSTRGVTLQSLLTAAERLGMNARAVQLELSEMHQLSVPAILHWDFSHFVVLEKIGASSLTILDPAIGRRKVGMKEVGASFTGVALELQPSSRATSAPNKKVASMRSTFGHVPLMRRSILQIIAIGSVVQLLGLSSPLMLQIVLDDVLRTYDERFLDYLAVFFLAILLLHASFAGAKMWSIYALGGYVNFEWHKRIFGHLLHLPIKFFESRHLGDISSRFGSIGAVQKIITSQLAEAVVDGFLSIILLLVIIIYSGGIALVSIFFLASYFMVRYIFLRKEMEITDQFLIRNGKQHTHFIESVRGVKTLRIFGVENKRETAWRNLLSSQIYSDLELSALKTRYQILSTLASGLDRIICIWFSAKMAMYGELTIGEAVALIGFRELFAQKTYLLLEKLFDFRLLSVHFARVQDITSAEAVEESHSQVDIGSGYVHRLEIELNDVWFRYSENDPYIAKGISISIPSGVSVALTGDSGSGKSTLLKIMLGLIKPSRGEVLINGVNISSSSAKALKKSISAVLQEDSVFSGTISQNISFFDDGKDCLSRVIEAAKKSGIHETIERFPMGYNTLIGDLGSGLSGGQIQRILLARALYVNPSLIFLDEATSHLDISSESYVNRQISSLEITRIIAAHRESTIKSADWELHLEQGQLCRIR